MSDGTTEISKAASEMVEECGTLLASWGGNVETLVEIAPKSAEECIAAMKREIRLLEIMLSTPRSERGLRP
jgi:hypothetical protein